MTELTFMTPPRIICAPGALARLGDCAASLGGRRAFVVTDPGLTRLGYDARALAALETRGISGAVFDRVEADPPYAVVREAVAAARASGADLVIGLGGGSSMDTAKVVALALNSDQTLDEMVGTEQATGTRLPLICVPTTAGTGSEVTFVSVLTSDEGLKKAIYSSKILPDVALLDAELTLGMPPHVTAAPALDAMVHAVEAYTSRTRKNPISDALAIKALQLLTANFDTVLTDGHNVQARSDMLLGSMMAGMAFVNASVGAVHALSYPLGARFHVPHGHSNALVMGPVFRFNIPAAKTLYAELAAITLPERQFNADEDAANAFVDTLEAMLARSGLQTRMGPLGVSEADIDPMAREVTEKITRLIATNPRDMTYDEVVAMYRSVL
ncbi:iron-containing alcohol dehydrogenase [Brucella tritici]|uniref:Alcohol dehydrogenase 2 n=1 Tax=Brucella tritici TaxID=94626 RepID=A0A6L3Y627_9HYPH|nr:iron-containing alcohol dehydrogenase [Brucella tritici]KAB2674571.1 iron-containing alcohol dehydrogenase [Brucella tritici]